MDEEQEKSLNDNIAKKLMAETYLSQFKYNEDKVRTIFHRTAAQVLVISYDLQRNSSFTIDGKKLVDKLVEGLTSVSLHSESKTKNNMEATGVFLDLNDKHQIKIEFDIAEIIFLISGMTFFIETAQSHSNNEGQNGGKTSKK